MPLHRSGGAKHDSLPPEAAEERGYTVSSRENGRPESLNRIKYTASISYTPERIRQTTKAQYNVFHMRTKLKQLAIAAAFLIPGAAYMKYTWGIALIAIGSIVFAALDHVPRTQAAELIKQYNGSTPCASYYFSELGVKTNHMAESVPYKELIRLAQDRSCLYLFRDEHTVFAVERESVEGHGGANGFCEYISQKTGQKWEQISSLMKMNMKTLVYSIREDGKK